MVLFYQGLEEMEVFGIYYGLQGYHTAVAALLAEVAQLVEDEGDAAGHAGGEVAAGFTQDHYTASGHVFAAVVAGALDHGQGAGVADGEALAGHTLQIHFAAGGAVEADVADHDVLLGDEAGGARRVNDHLAAGEALAHVVAGVAFELEGDALGQEGAEGLAGRAVELDVNGVFGEAGGAVAAGDLTRQDGADGAVDVANRHLQVDALLALDGRLGKLEQLPV